MSSFTNKLSYFIVVAGALLATPLQGMQKKADTSFKRISSLTLPSTLHALALHPTGTSFFTALGDATARQWDIRTKRELLALEGHVYTVTSLDVSTDGKTLLTGSDDETARLWDIQSGQELHLFKGHTREVKSVALSPDSNLALTGSLDGTVRLWNTETGQQVGIKKMKKEVPSVAFSPDGKKYAASNGDTARVWETSSGKLLKEFTEDFSRILTVTFSAYGNFLFLGLMNGEIQRKRIDDLSSPPLTLQGHTHAISSISANQDGKIILSGSWDKTARLWDSKTGDLLQTLKAPEPVEYIALSQDGNSILLGSEEGIVYIWKKPIQK